MLEEGLIERMFPESPRNPYQKYKKKWMWGMVIEMNYRKVNYIMNILVTGAAGIIGGYVVKSLYVVDGNLKD